MQQGSRMTTLFNFQLAWNSIFYDEGEWYWSGHSNMLRYCGKAYGPNRHRKAPLQ